MMEDRGRAGAVELAAGELEAIRRQFSAHRIDETETAAEIADLHAKDGYLADPHSAVGIAAAKREARQRSGPIVALGTAHPAKFPEAVERACGVQPPVPERLAERLGAEERYDTLPCEQSLLAEYVSARARVATKVAK